MDKIDDIGRRGAAAVRADAYTFTDADVDAMLESLADAAAAPRRTTSPWGPDRSPRRWAVLGAAAAVAAAVVAGVVVVANREPEREVVPSPSVPPSPVPTAPPDTEPASSTTATTSVPAATAPAATLPPNTGDGLAVSYKNPPPFLEPQLLGSVESADDGSFEAVEIMEAGVVVLEGTTATVVAWDGTTRQVDLSAAIQPGQAINWAAGPGDVFYAITISATNDASVVAIPLSGERAGEAVAATPISLLVISERPYASIGHGPTGLVDRVGRIHGVIAPYVDERGEPWPTALTIPEYRTDGDVVSSIDGTQRWPLQIERAVGSGDSYNGAPGPSPAPGGGAVWWDLIGPRASNGDYTPGTMQVIAFLAPDGSATWRRVPEGWGVVAADVWGTVLAKRTGTTLELALATSTVASVPSATPAEQAVTDYLTALAARDYEAAAVLLGNDGLSLELRPDLAPLRGMLAGGATLAEALRYWCTDDGAACWMPSRVAGTGADGSLVIADYDERDVGLQARYVVDSWEGQPSVFGLPPLAEPVATTTLRELLGVDTLWTLHPDDQLAGDRRSAVVTTSGGPRNVQGPPGFAALTVAPDGQTLWWSVADGTTIVTDTAGAIVCTTTGPILDLVGAPGAYRVVVERWGDAGPQEDPLAVPTFEIDCATGTETPAEPRSWDGGPVTRQLLTAGNRTFTLVSTDHHGELTNEVGLALGTTDRMITEPVFSPDGSIVVFGDNTGSANPSEVTRYLARDTSTDELLWTYEPSTIVTGVQLTADRAIFSASIDDAMPGIGTASLTAVDLATGQEVMTVPAAFTLLHVE